MSEHVQSEGVESISVCKVDASGMWQYLSEELFQKREDDATVGPKKARG